MPRSRAGASVLLWSCRPLVCKPGTRGCQGQAKAPSTACSQAHKLAQASRETPPMPPPRWALREGAHSGATAKCNSTGANQVPVPTVQWSGLPSHTLGSPRPAECGPCGRLGPGSPLSEESNWRRDSPGVCSGASPRAVTGPPAGKRCGACGGHVGGQSGASGRSCPPSQRGCPDQREAWQQTQWHLRGDSSAGRRTEWAGTEEWPVPGWGRGGR